MSSGLRAGPWLVPVPRVAELYLKAQTTAIGATVITVPAAGLYRITMAIAITTAGTGGTLTAGAQSTGDGGQTVVQQLAPVLVASLGAIAQDDFICEIGTGQTLNYLVTATGLTAGALKYTLRVTVEQLSILS